MKFFLKIHLKGLTIVCMSLFSLTMISCDKDDEVKVTEETVTLENTTATMNIGEELMLTPQFTPDVTPTKTYSWVSSNPNVVGVVMNEDYSVVVTAINSGTTTLTFSSADGKISASIEIVINTEDDGVLKVLAIGNSFSEDAVEHYLYGLAAAENVPIVIGNLYIGGASLDLHWKNAQNNAANYDYRRIALDGTKTSTPSSTIEEVVSSENWDYISLQQVSVNSGMYETFVTPLPPLVEYVKEKATNSKVQLILHQTWAYSENSTHDGYQENYNHDQVVMYEAIVEAVRKAQNLANIDHVIPVGTAIQNGRTSLIGDNFNRDGYHLNVIGKYTAASTWFESLTGINVIGNTYKPESLVDFDVEVAQHAAHAAVINPDEVTELSDYQGGNAEPLSASVLINFGHEAVPKWNTLTDHHEGASIPNLKDINDVYTDISLTVTQRFNAINTSGESTTTTALNMPPEVSSNSYFGNAKGVWDDLEIRQSQITLSGLNKDLKYDLCFYASRAGVGDNRETKYIVAGENGETVNLQTSNNTSEIVCTNGIQPDSNGVITITITAGGNNNNGFGFYYLGAMQLSPTEQ